MVQPSDEKMSDKTRSERDRFPELFREGSCVEREKCTRTTPLKVLCFGLPRTGTASMRVALANLGISRVHHMVDILYMANDAQWFIWANNAKEQPESSEPFTRSDWDKVIGDCQGTIDMPTAFFPDELISAYPEAKVVLMERDFDRWYQSMSQTIFKVLNTPVLGKLLLWLDYDEMGQTIDMARVIFNRFLGPEGSEYTNVEQRYHAYFEHIRRIVPQDRLLDFKLKDGYEPLCTFLDCEVPLEIDSATGKERVKPFPHVHETSDFQDRVVVAWRRTAQRIFRKYIVNPLVVGTICYGAKIMLSRAS